MGKQELQAKIEYMEMTRLLKVRIAIMRQVLCLRGSNYSYQKNDDFIQEKLDKNITKIIDNIKTLLNIINLDACDIDEALKKIDDKIFTDILPQIITGLKSGKFNYNWNFEDYAYSYIDISNDPTVRESYRNQIELANLETDRYREPAIGFYYNSDIKNPIYFDLYHLSTDKCFQTYLFEIINSKLYNPNRCDCLPSSEPYWGLIYSSFGNLDIVSKIMLDPRTNFQLLVNGSDVLEGIINVIANKYKEENTLSPKFNLLLEIIKLQDVSLLDTIRVSEDSEIDCGNSYICQLFDNLRNCNLPEVQELLNYCVTDQAIQKQIMLAKYPSEYRDRAIDSYCDLISERRGPIEQIDKLKKLKLY